MSSHFCSDVNPIRRVKWFNGLAACTTATRLFLIDYDSNQSRFKNERSLNMQSVLYSMDTLGNSIVLGDSKGKLHLVDQNLDKDTLNVHSSPVTSISCQDSRIASLGKNGPLLVSDSFGKQLTRVDYLDACQIKEIKWISQNSLVAATVSGRLLLLDLRTSSRADLILGVDGFSKQPFTTMDTILNKNVVATAKESGDVQIWDFRSNLAFSNINVHQSSVNSISLDKSTIYTCSEDGSLASFDWTALGRIQQVDTMDFHSLGWNSIDAKNSMALVGGDQSDLLVFTSNSI